MDKKIQEEGTGDTSTQVFNERQIIRTDQEIKEPDGQNLQEEELTEREKIKPGKFEYRQPDHEQEEFEQTGYEQSEYEQSEYRQPEYEQPEYRQSDSEQPGDDQADYDRTDCEKINQEQSNTDQAGVNREQADIADPQAAANIFDKFPRIYPFEDNEILICAKIEPKDIGMLPKELWVLSNNSFLVHGYYCYHHLIFAKLKDRYGCRYILGVPGIYHNRERFMARMFGFDGFKPIRKRELRQGDFGYWYMPVSF